MDIISQSLATYIQDFSSPESQLLKNLNRDTHANVLRPRMLSGHIQGRFLAMISKMLRPKAILEIGTYTGYSALCLAEGLQEEGRLITIDKNDELQTMVRQQLDNAGMLGKVDYRVGNALDIIPSLPGMFDLVFIDADKCNYCNYYQMVIDKVHPGSFIIADNVLWSGKVTSSVGSDNDLNHIKDFNKMVLDDPRVENVILSVRDGLNLICKL